MAQSRRTFRNGRSSRPSRSMSFSVTTRRRKRSSVCPGITSPPSILSSAGAQGPMQFIPATWTQYGDGGDINDDHDAIMGAARYLKAAGAPDNMQKALFAYNHSQAYVNALLDYANVMKADPSAYRGYHGWQVYYPTLDGPILMPVGWTKP